MRKAFAFDVQAAIRAAWDLLWADAVRMRGTDYRASHDYYLTATDVERAVRGLADLTAEGKPWPKDKAPEWYGYSRVRFRGNLNGQVRDWLFGEVRRGRLTSFNFGRGHISGARFRPAGEPVTETEKKTMAAKEARKVHPRLEHMRDKGGLLCVPRRSVYSSHRSKAWSTTDRSKVTCPRCLKLLKEGLKCA